MSKLADDLSAEFGPKEVLQFTGRAGRVYDYIEDETVMDRADAVLGLGKTSWSFSPVTDQCVKGSLDVAWPDGSTSHYEDFGYASNQDGESYKEAVSDAIRRLGRYIGIARYLYHKHQSNGQRTPPAARPPAAAGPPPRPAAADEPPFPGMENDVGQCPVHHKPWRTNSRGYFCSGKLDDGSWCKETPSKAWAARQEVTA